MKPEPKQVSPIPIQAPTTDALLEHNLIKSHEDAQTTHTLLEHHLVKGAEHDKKTEQASDNLLEATGKTHEKIENGAAEVSKAIEGLKPAMDAAGFIANFMAAIKGEKGETGEKGEQGERGIQGEQGVEGKASTVPGPQGEKGDTGPAGKDGKNGRDGLDGNDGKDGRDGKHGKDGKNGSSDSAEDIVAKHKSLPPDKRISYQDLKETPNFPRFAGTGYLREITDVDTTGLADGLTLKWSVAKQKWIVGTATGATPQVFNLSALLNGSTKSFTIPANTAITGIHSSSAPGIFNPTTDYTGSGTTTLTFTAAVDAPSMLASGQTILVNYY